MEPEESVQSDPQSQAALGSEDADDKNLSCTRALHGCKPGDRVSLGPRDRSGLMRREWHNVLAALMLFPVGASIAAARQEGARRSSVRA